MGAIQISFARGVAQGSQVILRLQSHRQVGAGGELASLPKKGAPLVRKGPSQGGCFEREAYPQSDKKWGRHGWRAEKRFKPRGELNKTLKESFSMCPNYG